MDTKILQSSALALQTSDHKSDVSFRWIARWVSSEIINLCEQLAGQQAKLNASHYSS
jgi:hypothetical protein